jgi:RNA polymerase sigma factor (TIGR02999 family)
MAQRGKGVHLATFPRVKVASMPRGGRPAVLSVGSRLIWMRAALECIPAGMELLRSTPLESRSGKPPGRPSDAVSMNNVTRIISALEHGDARGAEQLLPLVYDELRRLAAAKMARERPDHTLDPTALVHEAYLRLVGDRAYADHRHFFRVAAEAMRQILIDRARHHRRARHGGDRRRVPLSDAGPVAEAHPDELLALDEALERFSGVDPVKAELVKLRYFGGLSEQDAAETLGISRATASRYWTFARAWLINTIDGKNE